MQKVRTVVCYCCHFQEVVLFSAATVVTINKCEHSDTMWQKIKLTCSLFAILSIMSVVECFLGNTYWDVPAIRSRRAADSRVFVIRRSATGDLFSLAPIPPDPNMAFQWASEPATGLNLNTASGMISRDTSVQLGIANISFSISRTSGSGSFLISSDNHYLVHGVRVDLSHISK
jgi:hypothetical protein